MLIQDLTVHTMQTLEHLILQWAVVDPHGMSGPLLPGQIFDLLEEAQRLNTRFMEMNGLTAGWQEMASVLPKSNRLPPRAARIFNRVLALKEAQWPDLLQDAVALAYGKGWKSRVIGVGDQFVTFEADLARGGVAFKSDLYLAFHILTQCLQLSAEERAKLMYKRPYMVFNNVKFGERRQKIFERFQMWGIIPTEEELED